MQRRDFVRRAAVGMAAGATLAACGNEVAEGGAPAVQTQANVRWRLASSFPRSLDTLFGTAELLAERLSALTDGRFQIRVYPQNELVPFDQVLESVQKGTVQIGHGASYYFVGKNPALAFDTTVPFGLTARQHNAWLYHGGGLDLFRELFADFNIINFPGGNTGAQMGGWFRRELYSADDLRGLVMRIPGMGGRVMAELGVTAQVIGGGDIYPALERGAIDATEWVGPYDDEKLGFHKIVQNYYYPGWWEPGPALSFYVNRGAYDALPTLYQEALATAAAEANVQMLASYDAKNAPALQRLVDQGVQLRPFPVDVMAAAEQVSSDLLHSQRGDALYNKIHDAFLAWRTSSNRWFGTAEQGYANFVFNDSANAAECTI